MAESGQEEAALAMDKLSHEIFSILESKFLFGFDAKSAIARSASSQAISANSSSDESKFLFGFDEKSAVARSTNPQTISAVSSRGESNLLSGFEEKRANARSTTPPRISVDSSRGGASFPSGFNKMSAIAGSATPQTISADSSFGESNFSSGFNEKSAKKSATPPTITVYSSSGESRLLLDADGFQRILHPESTSTDSSLGGSKFSFDFDERSRITRSARQQTAATSSSCGESKFSSGFDAKSGLERSSTDSCGKSKFLSGSDEQTTIRQSAEQQTASSPGTKIRILSVDAGGATGGVLAAASLARLEALLQKSSSSTDDVRIADVFDVAAGSGVGGVLVALLFIRGRDGRPLFTAAEALAFVIRHRRALRRSGKKAAFGGIFRRRGGAESLDGIFRGIFGESTLRDALAAMLIPCYDLSTGAPFVFSRAAAAAAPGFDFFVRDVCAATLRAAKVKSVDGRTTVDAVDGGVAAANPAAAAITHVLNNRVEFPTAGGVEDLLVVSLGDGEAGTGRPAEVRRIAGEAASDMVDQAAGMAFGRRRATNYVRIQASVGEGRGGGAEEWLKQKNVEATLFRGRRVAEGTNAERLEWAAGELVREGEGRKRGVGGFPGGGKQGSPGESCGWLSGSSCSPSPMPASASPSVTKDFLQSQISKLVNER
ncbi:uncharacterized protein LOC144704986 [Wolffia australiana]